MPAAPQTNRPIVTSRQTTPSVAPGSMFSCMTSPAAETPVIRLKPMMPSVRPLISMAKPATSVGR